MDKAWAKERVGISRLILNPFAPAVTALIVLILTMHAFGLSLPGLLLATAPVGGWMAAWSP